MNAPATPAQLQALTARLEACRWDLSTLTPSERATLIAAGALKGRSESKRSK